MVRRLALGLALALAIASPSPARAQVLVIAHDSLATDPAPAAPATNGGGFARALASLWSLTNKSMIPNYQVVFSGSDSWTLAELRDSVAASATNPRYRARLMVIVGADRNQSVINPSKEGRLALSQLSKLANRPRVPILFLNIGEDASFQSGGNCSLGVTGAQVYAAAPLAYSPAGYQFPLGINDFSVAWVRGASGALPATGSYVTPVLSLGCYSYSKSNPNGVGGWNSHPGTVSDTLFAWFYNPPDVTTKSDRTTAGFGVMQWNGVSSIASGSNYPEGSLAVVAVGMMKRLAPELFQFPAARVAVEIDDGCKRFGGQASAPQILDALAGVDSLYTGQPAGCGIPFSYGIETDSMATSESGSTRFAIEWAAVLRNKGKVTVHNHRGVSIADSTLGASQGSASGGAYADIFGSFVSRYCFGTSAATRDKSVYSLLKGATNKLIAAAGGSQYVSRSVMAPTEDWSTILSGTAGGGAATYDSVFYAIGLAGYRVVRTSYQASSANHQQGGGVGGMPRGGLYPLPNARTIGAALDPPVTNAPRGVILAPNGYIYGSTTDTTNSTDLHSQLRINMNTRISNAIGFGRPIDMSTAQQIEPYIYYGTAREAIWVTHVPNWRHNLAEAVATNPLGTQRPGWTSVRNVHAAMMAARWAACATGNCAGPVEWHYADEITERDIR